jgi:putative thiamine transport system permease protein
MAAPLRAVIDPAWPRGTALPTAPMPISAQAARRRSAWVWPAAAFTLPLLVALGFGLADAVDATAWSALWTDAAWRPALALSLWVGVCSTLLSLLLAMAIVRQVFDSALWAPLQRALGAMLAVPHAAFAVGLGLLLMPSGLLMRLLAPLAGWQAPPDVPTVQDPYGLALIAGLVLKEVPFLLWTLCAQLQPVGQGARLRGQLQTAQTLGYGSRACWARVLWPQLLPRLALPVLAVWAYGLTVVDMALVLGPTRPPTLAVLAWQWLLDADAALNRQGAAAALLLTGVMVAGAALAGLGMVLLRPLARRRRARGDRPIEATLLSEWPRVVLWGAAAVYAAVLALLLFVSIAGVWTFPALWPQTVTLEAWGQVAASLPALGLTAALGLASAATGVLLAMAWLETTPGQWDARAAPWVFAPMLVPGVLLVTGLYRLALELGIDGTVGALWLAHSLFTAPYALVALTPAYRGFDARYEQTAQALGRSRAAFLWRIKWPMLLAPLAAAFAVGFAVSVTQYLSTQFVGAGRHATITTEALTLAAGGQRTLLAAFALLQALLPAAVFLSAALLARRQARRMGGRGAA